MTHDPTKRIRHHREAVKGRHIAKTACAAVVARNGIDGVTRAAVRALGAGEADFWGADSDDYLSPVTGQKTGVCDDDA